MMCRVWLFGVCILGLSLCAGRCGAQNEVRTIANNNATPEAGVSKRPDNSQTKIASLQIFGRWWSEEQLRLGEDRLGRKRPKAYIELTQWKETTDANLPHPDKIDIVCRIEGDSGQLNGATVEFTTDYLVAPVNYNCRRSVETLTDEVSWSGEVSIGKEKLKGLTSGQPKEIRVKDFDLRAVQQLFAGDEQSNYLWLWKLRIHAYVRNGDQTLAHKEAILSLLPRDGLCPKHGRTDQD